MLRSVVFFEVDIIGQNSEEVWRISILENPKQSIHQVVIVHKEPVEIAHVFHEGAGFHRR